MDKAAICSLSVTVKNHDKILCENGCPPGHIMWHEEQKCITNHHQCDNFASCSDYSDELPCFCELQGLVVCPGTSCELMCIPEQWVCDGYPDCPGGSEEINCLRGL